MSVMDALGWVATGAVVAVLLWAAHQRGRIHAFLRQRTPDAVVDAVRELWRARIAVLLALEA